MKALTRLVCLAVLLSTAGQVRAAAIGFTNQSLWQAAAGATSLFDFNADTSGDINPSKDFGLFTVERNSAFDLDLFTGGQPGNVNGTNFLSYLTSNQTQSIRVTFDDEIKAFALDWRNTDFTDDVIELIIGSSTFIVGGPGTGFFGVVEDTGASLGSPVVIQFSDTAGN